MDEELKLTDEQLRLATSRSPTADCALDAETAAARDTFLALGAMVESAARDFDEAALISRISISREQTCSRSLTGRNPWPLIATAALAAGMLLAVTRLAMERQQASEPIKVTQAAPKSFPPQTVTTPPPMNAAWNDPLDDEITLAAATINQFSHTTPGFDNSLLNVNDRLQALSQELQGETL